VFLKNLQDELTITRRLTQAIRTVIQESIRRYADSQRVEVAICLLDANAMRKLNRTYFGKNCSTDVIAFNRDTKDSSSPGKITGDIAICTAVATSNAKRFSTSVTYEILLYVAHGLLHILGYDDKTKWQQDKMEHMAKKVLATLGYCEKPCPSIKPKHSLLTAAISEKHLSL
jgi:probable rRNA maturation factor